MKSEHQLGAVVVAYLEAEGWDVYQEVQLRTGGPIADVVATSGPVVQVVELKRSFTLTLIGQASYWRRWAHVVNVAVPAGFRHSAARAIATEICAERGIGVLEVSRFGNVREAWPPSLARRVPSDLRETLEPGHKTHAKAGASDGGHFTPFRRTLGRLEEVVRKRPGISMRAAFDSIEHHYGTSASARAQTSRLIRSGVITSIEVRRILRGPDRGLRLYPADTCEEAAE